MTSTANARRVTTIATIVTALMIIISMLSPSPALAGQNSDHAAWCRQAAKQLKISPIKVIVLASGDRSDYRGTSANECVVGNRFSQKMYGGAGHDILVGGAGNDQLFGGDGNDALFGGPGNDTLKGERGNDHLYGDAGDDSLYGGLNNDHIDGGPGQKDVAYGENGRASNNSKDRCTAEAVYCSLELTAVQVGFSSDASYFSLGAPTSTKTEEHNWASAKRYAGASKQTCIETRNQDSGGDSRGWEVCVTKGYHYYTVLKKTVYPDKTTVWNCVKNLPPRGQGAEVRYSVCPSQAPEIFNVDRDRVASPGTLLTEGKLGRCKAKCSPTYRLTYTNGVTKTSKARPGNVPSSAAVTVQASPQLTRDMAKLGLRQGDYKVGVEREPDGSFTPETQIFFACTACLVVGILMEDEELTNWCEAMCVVSGAFGNDVGIHGERTGPDERIPGNGNAGGGYTTPDGRCPACST